ncbi:verrucotoxin subunit beta-like protein [Labeo rohita]|uniref:Verrucotoxin subunit beta-like protein n=1 Tax=Labeo rohita TaxID=84645 RepID=A0A498MDV8_LABRO|nr:verrucotoxin subunit beta-like protein [Labeo rohita]
MYTVGVNVIERAALGRPFQLGMLYDCRKDALIPGITLWDPEKLQQSIRTRPQINTDFKVMASDSIENKSSLLNIDGSLKLSLLAGLVNVTGAAKYLNNPKTSFRQQRLTLHYHSTCRFEELTMNHLAPENIVHHEVFDNDAATHVVTAVLYGADACFVFDREVSADEEIKTVEGEAKVVLEKLKFISVNVNINLKMTEAQKNAVQNFTCTFYGDFQLPSNPASFEDALKVFTDLPKLLGEKKELAVPLRVWLYPLDKLHTKASKLQKDISMDLIIKTESVIESLNTAEMKCSDLLKDSPASTFAQFQNKILQMKQNCYNYKLRLMKKLGSLLPNIRGDVMKETELNNLLQEHDKSPFRGRDLTEWLKEREKESEIIKSVLRRLKDAGAQEEVNLDAIWMDLEDENLVCYTFTSLNWTDVLLPKQINYLNPSTKGETDSEQKSWLSSDIMKNMRRNVEIFKKLMDSKDHKPARFIVSSREMKNNPGSCILLYEHGCDEAVCFIPPSKPVCPVTEEVKQNTMVLKVPPSCADTVELRLLYKLKQDSVWMSKPVMKAQHTVTLTDLRSGTEYEIKCAAVGKLNYTTHSDVIRVTTEGRDRLVMGATSYLNAVLQTLYMTQEYREHVMRLERREDSSDGDFIEELKSLFDKLDKESHPVSTAGISRSLCITNVYEHKDAAVYLDLILRKTPEPSEPRRRRARVVKFDTPSQGVPSPMAQEGPNQEIPGTLVRVGLSQEAPCPVSHEDSSQEVLPPVVLEDQSQKVPSPVAQVNPGQEAQGPVVLKEPTLMVQYLVFPDVCNLVESHPKLPTSPVVSALVKETLAVRLTLPEPPVNLVMPKKGTHVMSSELVLVPDPDALPECPNLPAMAKKAFSVLPTSHVMTTKGDAVSQVMFSEIIPASVTDACPEQPFLHFVCCFASLCCLGSRLVIVFGPVLSCPVLFPKFPGR